MGLVLTAAEFSSRLEALKSDAELKKYDTYFPAATRGNDKFLGVRMGSIFKLAKDFADMPLDEVEKLLESPYHEMRVGGVTIMDAKARSKKTSDEDKKAVFELYLKRHDRINTWDLVDRSGFWVVGNYLVDHPEKLGVLEKLAKSIQMAERRTAIIATGQIAQKTHKADATCKIAEMLVNDKDPLIHKAVGWMLRVAGDAEKPKLLAFLDKHASTMPREMLRYAIEKLDKSQKDHFLTLK